MFVSQVVSSSSAERRLALEMIEEEEVGVGILGQPHLRRGDVREQRHRNAVVLPRQRFAERAQELHRSLPPVAGDVARAHRRRSVLQDDEIDAGGADDRHGRGRAREREDHERARENHGSARTPGPPKIGNRSRTGSRRCWRNCRASRRRRASCHAQTEQQRSRRDQQPQSTAGRQTGAELMSMLVSRRYPFLIFGAAFARLGVVLALFAALRDDDLELAHVGAAWRRRRASRAASDRPADRWPVPRLRAFWAARVP